MSHFTRGAGRATKKARSRTRRIVTWMIFPIILLVVSGAAYAAVLFNEAERAVGKAYKPVNVASMRTKEIDPAKDNISILLMGIDDSNSRKFGNGTRSDALMVATLNKENKSIKLLSIPRDSYVYIPEKNLYTKITHAHAYGGAKLTIETVQNLLDIPIDYYVQMNFYAFMDVVNALGGINVNVPYALTEKDSEDHHDAIRLKPGLQTLNGEEALALARTRHKDSDLLRGQRQQEILKAIIKKAVSFHSLSKEEKLLNAIGDNMQTNMTFSDMSALINYALAGKNLHIDSLKLQGTDSTINHIYYYKLNQTSLESTKAILKKQLGLDAISKS